MKHYLLFVAALLISVSAAFAQISTTGYSLVYSSETPEAAATHLTLSAIELQNCTGDFSSIANMERNWNYCIKASSEWNQRMGTTDEEHALVHKTENGHLLLKAVTTNGTANGFITAGIRMKKAYKYGIIEVKAKCNPHASSFPAIWMMPVVNDGWPTCGEIDIMEMVGNSSVAHSTVHVAARYPNQSNGHSVGKSYQWTNSTNTTPGYHIYSLLWDKTSLIFYCDGQQVFRYNKDLTLDYANHPDYEKWQFPYNKEFELILNQALGKNSGWGYEDPDPSYTYEMDVEYVRIWQAPTAYEVNKYYLLRNYEDPTRFMTVDADNTLTTTVIEHPNSEITDDMLFGVSPTDLYGRYYLLTRSGKVVGNMPDINKAVPISEEGCYFYMLQDATKGVAFDYAKQEPFINYSNGSRALTLNTKKGNIVSISGTTKDAAWWTMVDKQEVITGISEPDDAGAARVSKVWHDGHLYIRSGNSTYTLDGRAL